MKVGRKVQTTTEQHELQLVDLMDDVLIQALSHVCNVEVGHTAGRSNSHVLLHLKVHERTRFHILLQQINQHEVSTTSAQHKSVHTKPGMNTK